jgi:hypothetical protein
MLDFLSRGAVVVFSAACVAGAIAFAAAPAPRPSAKQQSQAPPLVARITADAIAMVPIRRDPFAEPEPPAPLVAAVPARTLAGSNVEPLPSNLASDTIPELPGTPPGATASLAHVTAVVTGPHPYALLDSGGVHEIKGLGDRVGSAAIAAINFDGVRLNDGERLLVDPGTRR